MDKVQVKAPTLPYGYEVANYHALRQMALEFPNVQMGPALDSKGEQTEETNGSTDPE